MNNLTSLFLSQSYQDTWEDYNRSLSSENFPKWDYIILTASNENQAVGYRSQIESRRDVLPPETHFAVIPDDLFHNQHMRVKFLLCIRNSHKLKYSFYACC